MDSKLHVPIILGTSRDGRLSEAVARFVEKKAQEAGLHTEFIDVRQYQTPYTERDTDDPLEKAWEEIATWADGFIIVTPEYNHSFPGELKILLDKAFKEYHRKVVGVCAVSDGNVGGVRVYEHLQPVITALGMTTVSPGVYFTNADKVFDESGDLTEEYRDAIEARLGRMLTEFTWYAQTLKAGREQ